MGKRQINNYNKDYLKIQMHRTQQVVRRPSSNKVYGATTNNYLPLDYQRNVIATDSRIFNNNSGVQTIPLNQVSAINITTGPAQLITHYRSATKPTSIRQPLPNTRKIYFTYVVPGTFQVERRYVETVMRNPGTSYTNQWEQRYFQLEKQMHSFFMVHQKMALDFLKINDQLKINNQNSIRNSIEAMQKAMYLKDQQSSIEYKSKYQQLMPKYEQLRFRKQQIQKQANIFKQQNIRNQIFIQKLQQQISNQQKVTHKIQSQKNMLILQIKQSQFSIKQSQMNNIRVTTDKSKLQDQIYELKMTIAKKNMEIQQLNVRNQKKQQDKNKSPEKNSQQKFEQRLMKVKTQIQRKQKKKFDKLNQTKTKQVQELSKYIIELEQKERVSRQMKQKYEKMYIQKKEEVANLKYLQQSQILEADGEKQMYYEQKIQQLNKIAKEQGEKIKKLQDQKGKLQDKISQYSDNYVNQQHLAQLNQLLDQQKTQLLAQGGVNYNQFQNKATPYFNGKIFQQKLIYQLKKDNQKLTNLLSKINLHQIMPSPQIIINQNMMINSQSGCDLSIVMKAMIADTFFKLQRIAENIKNTMTFGSQAEIGSSGGQSPRTIKRQTSPPKRKKKTSHQQNIYQIKISNDLQILKVYIVDLNETCDKLVKQLQKEEKAHLMMNEQQKQVIKAQRHLNGIIPKNEQLIDFHKQKNKEMEQRIDELLKLNNFLKQKLTQKHPQQKSGFEYWKQQTNKLKLQIDELTIRYNKLLAKFQESEDKREGFQSKSALCAMEIQRLNKLLKQSQQKLTTTSITTKTVQQLTVIKVRIQRELSIAQHKNQQLNRKLQQLLSSIRSKQAQLLSLHSKLEEAYRNRGTVQFQNNQLKSRISKLQTQINQYRTKVQTNTKTNATNQTQLESIRLSIDIQRKTNAQLKVEINQLRMRLESQARNYNIAKNQNIQIRSKYQLQAKNRSALQLEFNDYRSKTDSQINRSRTAFQNQINQLRNKLQIQIKIKEGIQFQLNELKNKSQLQTTTTLSTQSQLIELRNKLQIQINSKLILQNQIAELNRKLQQQSKNKSNSSNQILHGLDPYIHERLRSMIIETEVLTKQLSILVSNRNNEISHKIDTNYSEMLMMLANVYSVTSGSSMMSAEEISVYKQRISQHRSKIEMLEKRIREGRVTNLYKTQMIRSLFIELQCFVFEIKLIDARDRDIVKRIKEHVGMGLQNISAIDLFDGY